MMQALKPHWPFALLAALGLALVLTNLGSDYLWADEGDTAVLGSTILKCGLPKAWDEVTFTDSDKGARLNDDLVMVSHPWAQYYVAAASFFAFGQNTFAARLPFALAGWMTILLTYAFVWRISANRLAAFGAAALALSSVQFLLYARQCRNYSLNMLLTCGLIWIFFEMKSARCCVWRPQWEDYQGYRWTDVEEQVRRRGGRLTQVAELRETYWENRENIHFRRFSGDVHIFLGIGNFPPAGVFRVDWPATPSAP